MAITHAFEQKPLTCTASHVGRASRVTFTFFKDGTKLDPPVKAELKGLLDKSAKGPAPWRRGRSAVIPRA